MANNEVAKEEVKPQDIAAGGMDREPDARIEKRSYEDISREITDAHKNPQRREELRHTDPHVDEKYSGVGSEQLYNLILRSPWDKGDEAVSAALELVARSDQRAIKPSEVESGVENLQNALRQGMTLDANNFPERNMTDEDRLRYHGEAFVQLASLRTPGWIREVLAGDLMRFGRTDEVSSLVLDALKLKESIPTRQVEEQIRLLTADEKRFDDRDRSNEIHRAVEYLMGGRDQTDTRYLSDGLGGRRTDNPDRLSVQDFASVASFVFDRVDADKDGYLNNFELKNSCSDQSIVGKDKDAISTMHANLDMFQQLSNDEWGNETSGITRKDLGKFGEMETMNFQRLSAIKEAREHLVFGRNFGVADKDGNGFLSSTELQSVVNDSQLTGGQSSSYSALKGVVDGLPRTAKGIGLAELLRPIDERVLKVNFNLYKDYSDRHVFREVNAPK